MCLLRNYLFKYLILIHKSNSKQRTCLHVFVFFIHQPIILSIDTWWKRVSLYPLIGTAFPLGSDFLDHCVLSEVNLKPGLQTPESLWAATHAESEFRRTSLGCTPSLTNDEALIAESGILLSSIPRASIHAFKRRASNNSFMKDAIVTDIV